MGGANVEQTLWQNSARAIGVKIHCNTSNMNINVVLDIFSNNKKLSIFMLRGAESSGLKVG